MCKFIHFRRHNPEMDDDIQQGPIETKGGMTVAFEESETGHVEYAVAYCSPRDNYCRKTGRTIAQGRLKAGKSVTAELGEGSIYEFLQGALND